MFEILFILVLIKIFLISTVFELPFAKFNFKFSIIKVGLGITE